MEKFHIVDRLYGKMDEKKTPLMIGLDPNLAMFPKHLLNNVVEKYGSNYRAAAEAIRFFNFAIIDATYDLVSIFKPQSAYYEYYGSEGIRALEDTIRYVRSKGALVCLDAKRNDILETAQAYAEGHLGQVLMPDGTFTRSMEDLDFITVNGYLGSDGITPFIDVANRDGKGIFVLSKTSNKSSGEIQDLLTKNEKEIYLEIAELSNKIGEENIGENGYSNLGLVVGATYPYQAEKLRKIFPRILFLMPGYGAQGAKAEILINGFDHDGRGAVINSARAIDYAFSQKGFKEKHPGLAMPEKFDEAARQATIDSITEINNALKRVNKLPPAWDA